MDSLNPGAHRHSPGLKIPASRCSSIRGPGALYPINLSIVKHKDGGVVEERDCLKCPECIAVCPKGVLSWPEK